MVPDSGHPQRDRRGPEHHVQRPPGHQPLSHRLDKRPIRPLGRGRQALWRGDPQHEKRRFLHDSRRRSHQKVGCETGGGYRSCLRRRGASGRLRDQVPTGSWLPDRLRGGDRALRRPQRGHQARRHVGIFPARNGQASLRRRPGRRGRHSHDDEGDSSDLRHQAYPPALGHPGVALGKDRLNHRRPRRVPRPAVGQPQQRPMHRLRRGDHGAWHDLGDDTHGLRAKPEPTPRRRAWL